MHVYYPEGTVRALLATDQVTEATRQVLLERLTAPPQSPKFFSATEFVLLQTICNRLIPQEPGDAQIDIAGGIDKRLSQNESDGWRYDVMPPDGDTYKLGLTGVDETAQLLFKQPFQQLSDDQQDEVLMNIQRAVAPGQTWEHLPAGRFFEELLVEATHIYYSHPLAQEVIGYVGMADVPTWQRIGLNELEGREPQSTEAGGSELGKPSLLHAPWLL
ncbi:gluconate 2-dehydrogenase subunit 3 family protein [Spirosoma sp. HMF4905]|uniref:Gluconate 2-dehydrogenase subunit 3 family protein n=1 Tax=Spirosoma arboris TaxID=2682092 RepID=A0A7K1S4C8_9BACT|nr:gluconate 2-dehydrogenase subunit 3 family protein [Spirosoma arboris]MVM28683.1 gluconate 2-dehydrogenase subunit 3 family protein [Spirosoma arboris]